MGEETKAHLDGMMLQIDSQFERILDNLALSERITKIEDEMRRR